jgi:hypothetical protein
VDLLLEVDMATSRYGLQLPWVGPEITAFAGSASLAGPPAAPASILVFSDRDVPAGDLAHPTGAVTFSTAPTSIEFISGLGDPSRYLELHYLKPVTPAAPLALTHTFSMAPTATASAALAARAEDASSSPAVTITAPKGGSTVPKPTVTVTGTATDNRGVTGLTVGGIATAVGAGGAWSQQLALKKGANTIVAHATDAAGNVTEASVVVTYAKGRPCVVPKVKGLRTPGAAVPRLRRAGCRLGKTIAIYSPPRRVRKGRKVVRVVTPRFTVLGSKQKQGRRLAPGAKVDLIVQGRKPKRRAARS